MYNKYNFIFSAFIILLLLGISEIKAQQSFVSSGGVAEGTTSSSYSIGQIFYTEISSGTHSLIQGVQQPYEISRLALNEINEPIVEISVSPNPATHILQIHLKDLLPNLNYKLYNINGKLITEDDIHILKTQLDLSQLSPSIYFLIIQRDNITFETFKIIKN